MSNTWLALRLAGIVIVLLVAASLVANGTPTVTSDVSVANGIKTYTYTFTNSYSGGYIDSFWIGMPPAGADAVIDITSTQDQELGWFAERSAINEWTMGGMYVPAGETINFWLTTADDVPTVYDYVYPAGEGQIGLTNWSYGLWLMNDDGRWLGFGGMGNSSLPVPAPEPSSLLSLLCGLGGISGMWLRRRK